GNVSYELRTPLTTIVGYADMLKMNEGALPEKARDYLDSIQAAATQLARSIDDVLDMAQIDAGEMGLSVETLTLGALVQASVQAQEEAAAKRKVRLTLSGLEDAGSALIRADARRLSQIVSHLIDNALRSAPEDTSVDVSLEKGPAGLRIDVTDHGRGIPFHVQAHIFDRFVGRERGGPGLGLALVKALVELHGGWVALESEPGKGATFSVHLPRYEAVSAA
ncbi:MAG: sensor histidine kinase, partial [Asticcacaulis sp.]